MSGATQGMGLREDTCARMGPRIREDTGGWVPVPVFGGRLCAGGWVPASARTRGGRLHPHPSLPPSRGKEKERGWVPASARTRVGMGSRPCLHGVRLSPALTRGWVPASARTRVGMGSRPCLHGGRLCAGIDEGMGPRIREDTGGKGLPIPSLPPSGGRKKRGDGSPHPRGHGGDGFPSLSSRGQALRRHSRGDGSPHPRGHEGDGFPSLSSRGAGSSPADEGMGPRIRETFPSLSPRGISYQRGWDPSSVGQWTRGGGRLHPHPSLPPSGGRKKRGDGSPHPEG